MSITEELPVTAPSTAPLVLGRYRLGRRLGAGGFGTVYAARDERLDRDVAVKVIPADGEASDRARREAVAAARLDHPGVVAIHDAGEEPGARYLVSELVEGRTLAQLEKEGVLSDRDVLRVGLALADALEHAHERGVIHRDVKPQNVIVPEPSPMRPRCPAKLTDFGVAHLAGDEPLTVTGDVVGTLAYMAPEQAAGERIDERADLYALALVVYEALAHHHPVKAANPAATAQRIGTVLPSLAKRRKDLPEFLVEAIDRALLPDPDARGELADLADALADAFDDVADGDGGGAVAHHPIETQDLPTPTERAGAALAAGALSAAALAWLGPEPLVAPALAGLAAAVLVALFPGAGWLLASVGTVALVGGARPGTAVVLFAAAAAVPLLVRRTPAAWSLPALAPILGWAALAGAFPALAGRARRLGVRAGLGAAGAWWLLLAEPLTGETLLWGRPTDVPWRPGFEDGASLAAADVIGPLVGTGVLALAALWAAAALVLPWIVRGRSLAADVVAATTWSAGLAAATASTASALALPEPRGLVLGAIAAGAVAVVPRR